jgi:hypothetical protein
MAQYTPGKYNLQLQCPDAPYDPECQVHRGKGEGGMEAACGTKARPWWDHKTKITFPSVFVKVLDPVNCTRNGCR